MKNTCVKCGDTWGVTLRYVVALDETDRENLIKHGQLYSICEDCSESGMCESVEP